MSIVLVDSNKVPLIGMGGGSGDGCSSDGVGVRKMYLFMQSLHNVYAHDCGWIGHLRICCP